MASPTQTSTNFHTLIFSAHTSRFRFSAQISYFSTDSIRIRLFFHHSSRQINSYIQLNNFFSCNELQFFKFMQEVDCEEGEGRWESPPFLLSANPTHSEGENEPIIPPPLSPILREHSFVNPTFNKGSESGDDVAQSRDSLVKAVSDHISIMWHTLMESEEKARQRSQEVASGPVQPNPVEAAPRVADLGNHQQPRYLPPPRRPNGGHQQHNATPQKEHFQPYVPPVQQNLPNLPGQYINRDQIIYMVQEAYGPVLRPLVRPAYRKPYPDYIDQENPFPRGFKVPEFTLFSGDGGYSSIEHIGRFTIQCGEASSDDNLKLRFFPSSLTSTTLTWYLSLPQNSAYTCRQMEDLFHIQFYCSEPEVSMADLSHLVQRPGETSEAFLAKFRKARLKCRVALPEQEFDKIDKGILRFPDKAKETMGVDADPFPTMSVVVNAADLRSITRDRTQTYYRRRLAADDLRWVIEEAMARRNQVRSGSYRRRQLGGHNSTQQKNNANQGTAISGRAEKPRMVKPSPRSPTKRWERVVHPKFPKDQAQPLPARRKSVWVRKKKGSTSGQNSPKKEEPPKSPTSPRVLAVESNEETGLKAKFDVSDKAEISSDVICFGEFFVNLSCLVITLPLVFQAREQPESAVYHQTDLTEEEEVIEIPAKEDGGMDSADKIIFEKPEKRMTRHIRPLYIHAHLDGMPINRVLVDNGAAANVLPTCILHKIGKSLGDLMETEVTISDFTGGVNRSRGILPVELTIGNRTLMCAFFVVDTIATYNALLGRDWIHSSWCVPSTLHQKLIFWNGGRTKVVIADDKPFVASTNAVEARYYDEDIGTIRFFGMDRYGRPSGITACTRSAMDRQTVKEVFEVVYEGEEEDLKDQITLKELDLAPAKLDDLKAEYKDCFAWDYSEMPGLDRNLVEHRLPIRPDFKPFKQPPRRMSPEVTLKVKEEIEQLLKVGFIRTSRYMEWLSNVVPVVKKNGNLRICVDFRNLNLATPKDEYPMPVADLLVDGVARHRILSFMDGHSGYNQIFIAEEDIPKTAFRCPGAIGTYEWVVMPFGLKNAGATYQRATNAIFHDMIGRFMEIYIDDVVVKSNEDEEHLEHLKLAFERMRKHGLKMNPLKCAFGVSAGNFLGYLVHERGLEVDQNKARAVIEAQPPRSRIGKWVLALSEFNLKYMPQKAVKGQALADFLADHPCLEVEADEEKDFNCTNNQAEYEALIIGLEVLVELKLLEEFDDVILRHVTRDLNIEANEMAQIASGLKIPEGVMSRIVVVEKRILPSIHMRDEYCQIMSDVHNEICGAHQAGIKMRWLIHRHEFFWPSILKDCISYAKCCKACQIHGPLQRVPAGHSFIIVATDYFTKWVEAKPMKKVDQTDIIKFLKEEIIHRFGLPETVTSDQGTVFVGAQVEAFAKEMGFRLLTSTPHYAQANGQAEASNRIVINLLEKMVDDNPRRWHELLSDTIWAYRTSQRSSTKVTPFSLTYGHDAVLPMELSARSLRIAIQHGLTFGEYNEAMILELEDLEGMRLTALDRLQTQKLKVARAYNKRVKSRSLAEGDLVWKVILPPGKKDPRFGKWSPNWERPFRIHEVLRGRAYWLESLNEQLHPRKINEIYLKPYYPMIWEARGLDTIDST
ncbi:hypothetical protein SLEP1_g26361 [Rubroshorea leprosula]|uniref:Reverse transcriptase n=1 Tax=Rubroshorea leprosula TaxID=152421 RepID=A0AAV5JXG3_9ROSI|nr:hypothetical protein SLEP1_g26361 [Rubroshorea leprosula]